jgi:DNA-binding MarR family transcriptional regulator
MIVSDRVSEAGRAVLRDAGWGWLDRRGDLRLWSPGIRIEATVPGQRTPRTKPLNMWTPVGLEIALAAMIEPEQTVTARKLAPKIGRSAGAIHELLGRFIEQGLIGKNTHKALMPDLFWEASAHWPDEGWLAVAATVDQIGTLLGASQVVRVDERAATMGGAKITAAGNLAARMYLTSPTALRKVRSLVDREQPTRSWVRLAPVTWLPDNENYPPTDTQPWRVAHRVVCALRLAADPARGQEIVEAWGVLRAAEPT